MLREKDGKEEVAKEMRERGKEIAMEQGERKRVEGGGGEVDGS